MSNDHLETGTLSWKVFRLTEKAISLLDSGRLDDAIAVIDNRERLLNLLSTRADVAATDSSLLLEAEKLNQILLLKFTEARERLRQEISQSHKNAELHRAYQSNTVK
jgi:ABC-type amino acid transport substrate-binding protein